MPEKEYDILIIGAGPGGYVCAIRAAQLGLKTALVEKSRHLGGTCLNVGCIPSKTLLHGSEQYYFLRQESGEWGIKADNISIDLKALMYKKSEVVDTLRKGVRTLCQKRSVDILEGTAKITGQGEVVVNDETIRTGNIVIATGSKPTELPPLPFDKKHILSSDQAIALESVPRKLAVVGGGAIGLELGSVWSRLGSQVTIIEFLPHIAPSFDPEVSKMARRIFERQGMKILTETTVTGHEIREASEEDGTSGQTILLKMKDGKEESSELEVDKVLICVGRSPFTDDLGLSEVGVDTDKKGFVTIDEEWKTTMPGTYAIGDVAGGAMLAHKAEEEGVAVAELIAGKGGHVNYATIPNVVYTHPEIASVGLTETQAKDKERDYRVGKFSFSANGRALASGTTDGFVKILADSKTDRILGVQIIGAHASELIAEAVSQMEYGGSAEDLGRTIHAHPTLAEALKEASLSINKSAIHAL